MLPSKCKDLGCRRHMVTAKGEDVCAIEKTKKGIGVVPVFSVSEKNCRMIRLLPKKIVPMRVSSGLGPDDDTVVETPHFEVHHDDTDTIPTRE